MDFNRWRGGLLYVVITGLLWLGLSPVLMAGDNGEFVIQAHQVGTIKVGMTAAEIVSLYPANRVKQWQPFPRVQVIDVFASAGQSEPVLRVNLDYKQKSWAILVYDRRCRTMKKIGLGSTYGELRRAHPQVQLGTQAGEMDRYIQAELPAEGIHFYFKYDEALYKHIESLPDDAPITELMIS